MWPLLLSAAALLRSTAAFPHYIDWSADLQRATLTAPRALVAAARASADAADARLATHTCAHELSARARTAPLDCGC